MAQINFTGETEVKEVVSALSKDVAGKTFLITGPSKDSLGAEVATALAAASPKHIILVGRNKSKIDPVIEQIKATDAKIQVTFVSGDFCDNATLRKAAAEINALDVTIDSIICSAGTMAVREFTPSKDGIENQFAANFLGHFLLVNLIIGKLAKESTFVTVTSAGYEASEVNFDDVNYQEGKTYGPWYAYGQATTAKILFAYAMGKKPGVTAFSVHPGFVPETSLQANNGVDMDLLIEGYKVGVARNGSKDLDPSPPRTIQQGAATITLAAIDPSMKSKSPAYLLEGKVKVAKEYATSEENVQKLWTLGNKLVGEKFPL